METRGTTTPGVQGKAGSHEACPPGGCGTKGKCAKCLPCSPLLLTTHNSRSEVTGLQAKLNQRHPRLVGPAKVCKPQNSERELKKREALGDSGQQTLSPAPGIQAWQASDLIYIPSPSTAPNVLRTSPLKRQRKGGGHTQRGTGARPTRRRQLLVSLWRLREASSGSSRAAEREGRVNTVVPPSPEASLEVAMVGRGGKG